DRQRVGFKLLTTDPPWKWTERQTVAAYKPTEEQQAIIDTYLTGGGLVVEAGAGAGKTSTLRMCAQADPRRSILYLAYNRSIADEARSSMPSNVRAQTIHSVAYREIGAEHRKRGREIAGRRIPARDRKTTRLNSSHVKISY